MTVETSAAPVAKRPALAAEPVLVALDALAAALLAYGGAAIAAALDPISFASGEHLPAFARAFFEALLGRGGWLLHGLAILFSLLGPLGAGIERGRAGNLVRAFTPLGAALGSLLGAWYLAGVTDVEVLLVRTGVPLLLGPFLVRLGARLHRPEEAWRAEARLRPAEATPALAVRIAHARLPLVLRIVVLPVIVALIPFAVAGLVLIRCYQLVLSRILPPQCRFEPSCSRYGFQAIFKHGTLKGFLLTAFRLARCQPFCRAGHDPVPEGS